MATTQQKQKSDLGAQAMALAEQLGRIAGTIEGTAEAWLHRQTLADQLTRVRDGAAEMLDTLAKNAGRGAQKNVKAGKKAGKAAPATARSADPAHAPGKKRRKAGPSLAGVKKSDERIPKMRTAEANRQRRKSYA